MIPSEHSILEKSAASLIQIHEGDCWVFFAFDIGYGINLDEVQKLLGKAGSADEAVHRAGIAHQRRAERYLQFTTPPLQIDQTPTSQRQMQLCGFTAAPRVECTLFDFGALSVAYRIDLSNTQQGVSLESLIPLAGALGDNQPLWDDARKRAEILAQRFASVIERPGVVDLVEDYVVYHIRKWSPAGDIHSLVRREQETIARLLLAETGPLSTQAIEAAVAEQISYSPTDITIIDWNAAIIFDERAEDVLAVLEFANVELLEMRYIDDRLDSIFDRSYASFMHGGKSRRTGGSPLSFLLDPHRGDRRRLAALQMENAILFEGINNTLKLLGDQHLARLYAIAARRLHLADWDQSILRKLHSSSELYQKLADEHSARRMEILEWIIIFLIAISILLPFFMPGHK